MLEALSQLLQLQTIDDGLRATREARKRLAKLRQENAESLEMFAGMLAERAERIEEARKFCVAKEAEVKSTEDDIRRSRARLPSITNQRELNALNKELEVSRRNNTKRSEELAKLRAQLGEVEADHQKKTEERDALAQQMTALEADLVADLEAKEAQAAEFQEQRVELRKVMDKPLLSRYDRISRGRGGWAVALANSGSCAACHVAPPPQTFIRLQRQQTIEKCNNCQRLLVYTGEPIMMDDTVHPSEREA